MPTANSLPYLLEEISLVFFQDVELHPWIGPALRGMVAGELKRRVCVHTLEEQNSIWKYCKGCSALSSCSYGQTYEPEPKTDIKGRWQQKDAPRPVVLSPYFPLPAIVCKGQEIPVRLLAVGQEAMGHVPQSLTAFTEVGRHAQIEGQKATFDMRGLIPGTVRQGEVYADTFPSAPNALAGVIPRVSVGLMSPLFLKRKHAVPSSCESVVPPSLADLMLSSMRSITSLFANYAMPLEADFSAFKAAALQVELVDHCYELFEQPRWSNRQKRGYVNDGIIGGGVYKDVPLSFLPWLLWGGRFHAGTHRVAGAGRWRLILD